MRIIGCFLFLAIALLMCTSAHGQNGRIDTLIVKYVPPADTIKYWDFDGNYALTLQHVGFHDWAKGGEPNVNLATALNIQANWAKYDQIFEGRFDAGFGFMHEPQKENTLRKNDDYFILMGSFAQNLIDNWYLEGVLDFRSQFIKGYKYDKNTNQKVRYISNFMAPAYLRPAIGLSYKKNNFSFSGSPVSGKITIVVVDSLLKESTIGVSEHLTSEAGVSLSVSDKRRLVKNVELRYSLLAFSVYNDFFDQFPDLNGELYLRFKVTKFISSFFNTRFIYDTNVQLNRKDDQGNPIEGDLYVPFQINYTLNIGFAVDIWKDDK
jgi:hypothetical protein